ncbi:MAG: response regulator [Rhodospirillales bacterium]|nr:response regulator [Rhodospirillales bacterium]
MRPFEVLLVEDNEADARLVAEAFKDADVPSALTRVEDGVHAMDYLLARDGYTNRKFPDLVLLDLNMPRKDGRQVLAEIRKEPNLAKLPVIALTTSEARRDVDACYELGANAYIVKPNDLDTFLDAVRALRQFWLEVATLPRHLLPQAG